MERESFSCNQDLRAGSKMMLVLLTMMLGVVLIWMLLLPPSRLRFMGNKIPGPRAYPIVGNIFNFIIIGPKAPDSWKWSMKKYGNTFRVWLGPQFHMFLTEPDDIQMILSSQSLITKAESYKVISSWLGTGLLVSGGELWQRRRKAITPTFHFKILEEFVPIFNKCARILVDCFKDKVGKGSFLLTEYMSNCALDAIAETAMGTELKTQINPQSEYPTSIFKMTTALMERINNPLLSLEPLFTISGQRKKESDLRKILYELPQELIRRKKNVKASGNNEIAPSEAVYGIKKKTAFLELLLELQKKNVHVFQTDQDIRDEVITFMFEGHDTTTMALTFTTWLLGKHLKIQEDLYHEVSSILGGEEPTMEDYQKMVYLDRIIKESLRLYPSVPIIARMATEDIILPSSGYIVPAGAHLNLCLYALHRREDLFPDPDTFNPDRYLEPQKHPFAYLPFSAGPRNCIGQKFAMLEMKVVISNLVLKYQIMSNGDITPSPEMILRSAKGPNITLTPRKWKQL